MKLKRETAKKRATEPPAVRIGLKPPGGGRIKWVKDGFAWDLFVLSPLLGLPLFRRKLESAIFDIVISDIRLGHGEDGLSLLRFCRSLDADVGFLLITGHGSMASAVEALRIGGASDYLLKDEALVRELPRSLERILEAQSLRRENRSLRRELQGRDAAASIIGTSSALLNVKEVIRTVACTSSTVLILGESGTGKEMVARALHAASTRADKPMISVNCGAFPETLLESELYGYVKGAFTGANNSRRGLFEAAEGGTLFLDEIGEMSLQMQVSLLRVLQERQIRPLGANQTIPIDVRVIAATHQDLERAVAEGRFREDLYYRISVIPIVVPPLRERREDIPVLAQHFLRRFAEAMGRQVTAFHPESIERMLDYGWPGNVRQLENMVERSVAMAAGDPVTLAALPQPKAHSATETSLDQVIAHLPPLPPGGLEHLLEQIERHYLRNALESANGVRTEAADLLRMTYRSFRHYARKYGV